MSTSTLSTVNRLPFLLPGMVVIAWSQDGQKKKRSPWPALIASIGNWKKCNEANKNHSTCVFLCRFLYGRFEAQLAKTSAFGLFSYDAITAGHIEPFPADAQTCRALCKRFIDMKTLSGSFSPKFSAQAFEAGWVEAAQLACGLDFSLTDIDDGEAPLLLSGLAPGVATSSESEKNVIRPERPSLHTVEASEVSEPPPQILTIPTVEESTAPVLQNTSGTLPATSTRASPLSSPPPLPSTENTLLQTIHTPSEIFQRIMNYVGPVGYPLSLQDLTTYSRFALKGGIVLRDRQVLILKSLNEDIPAPAPVPSQPFSIQNPRSNTRRRAGDSTGPEQPIPINSNTPSTSAPKTLRLLLAYEFHIPPGVPLPEDDEEIAYADDDDDDYHSRMKRISSPRKDGGGGGGGTSPSTSTSPSPSKDGGSAISSSDESSTSSPFDVMNEARMRQCFVRGVTIVELSKFKPVDKSLIDMYGAGFVKPGVYSQIPISEVIVAAPPQSYTFLKEEFDKIFKVSKAKVIADQKAQEAAAEEAKAAVAKETAWGGSRVGIGGVLSAGGGGASGGPSVPQASVLQTLVPGGRIGGVGGLFDSRLPPTSSSSSSSSSSPSSSFSATGAALWDPALISGRGHPMPSPPPFSSSSSSSSSSASSVMMRKGGPTAVLTELVQSQLLRAANSNFDAFPQMVGDANDDGPLVFPATHLIGEIDEKDVLNNHYTWAGGAGGERMSDANSLMGGQKRPRSNDDIMYAPIGSEDSGNGIGIGKSSALSSLPYYSDEAVAQRAKISSSFVGTFTGGGIINGRLQSQPGATNIAGASTSQFPHRLNLLEEQFKVAYAAAVSATDPDPYTTARRSVDHLLPEYAKFANVGQAPLGGWIANTSRKHYAEILTGSFTGPDLDSIIGSNGGAVIKPDGTGFHISEAQLAQMKAQNNLLKVQAQVVAKKPVRTVKPAGRLLTAATATAATTTTTMSRSKPGGPTTASVSASTSAVEISASL